jgi:hypothetical protein
MICEADANEEGTKVVAVRAAIDAGIAELDAGLGDETTAEELMAEVFDELAFERFAARSSTDTARLARRLLAEHAARRASIDPAA